MLLTDVNSPLSVQPRRAGFRRISPRARFVAPAILLLSLATFGATVAFAQDQSVAEAARQERARKQELQKHSAHVYTEDDLKHARILTPQDRAIVEAKKNECAQKNNCSLAPPQNPPAALDANSQPREKSLGEIARAYRKQKELQALKPKQSEPFHLSIGTPALAAPILPERPEIHLPVQPELHTKMPSRVLRRDPFAAIPVRPEVRRPETRRMEVRPAEIRPAVREDVRPKTRAGADTSSRENILPEARPRMNSDVRPTVNLKGDPKVRQDIRPVVHSGAPLDFSDAVRPTLRFHVHPNPPSQPKFFSHRRAPGLLFQPMQPPAPSELARPSAPVAPVRSLQPPPIGSAAKGERKTVIVQSGDSLWRLAHQNFGRGSRWPELLALNPQIVNPNRIRSGAEICLQVPTTTLAAERQTLAGSRASTMIQVRKGDTLWALAKSSLGRSSDWPSLAAANPSVGNPDRIYAGQHLLLPTACGSQADNGASTRLGAPHPLSTKLP